MNTLEKMNQLVGAKCWHGSPGIPVEEKIQAINVNIKDENVRVEFESGFSTKMSIETMDELLEQWEDGNLTGAEQICAEYFGLEPDYVIEFL